MLPSRNVASTGSQRIATFVNTNGAMNTDAAHALWQGMSKSIEAIQNDRSHVLRFEELYRNSYNMVMNNHGDMLYNGTHDVVRKKAEKDALIVRDAPNENLLSVLCAQEVGVWSKHTTHMKMIADILMYLERSYCTSEKKPSVTAVGLSVFKDVIINEPTIKPRIQQCLLEEIQKERTGQLMDTTLVRAAVFMLAEAGGFTNNNAPILDTYKDVFENEFLVQSQRFYSQEASDFFAMNSIPDYLKKAETRLLEEEQRAAAYLHPSTREKLLGVVQNELITKHVQTIMENTNTGAIELLKHAMVPELACCFRLFDRVKSPLVTLKDAMLTVIKDKGSALLADPENQKNAVKFVQAVLDLRITFENVVTKAFQNNRDFVRALREGFEAFLNSNHRSAQCLAQFIDYKLREGLKGVGEKDIEDSLEQVMTIFRYLQDKDVFEEYYKKYLATRLMENTRVNDDAEKRMIAKLKTEWGHQFTSKLEGMFKDMRNSQELMDQYKKLTDARPSEGDMELEVSVLTTGFWPIPGIPACRFSGAPALHTARYATFYLNLHNGRKLTWQTHLGTAELRCEFSKGRKEIICSTYQMIVMLLYNQRDSYTYQDLKDSTNIPENELQRQVLSLAHPKLKLLVKNPPQKKVLDTDTYTYNAQFTNSLFRVKVPMMAAQNAGSDKPADDNVADKCQESRKNRVDAAIVRIMKARKVLSHNDLVTEVARQLSSRFRVDGDFIKARIEGLIDREFLERDADDRKSYRYLA